MKLTCSQKDLSFALNNVARAVSPSTTLPVLNNILLKVEGGKMFFSATNLEIAINSWINCDVKNEGSITIPAKILTNYISLLKDKEVDLRIEEGFNLVIKTPTSQTKIKGISADEFPIIPKIEKIQVLKIPPKIFEEAINQVVFAASNNVARPILTGVLFKAEGDELKLVATDSYRLAEKKIQLPNKVESPFQYIVPARTTLELSRIIGTDSGSQVEIQIGKNQILFKVGSIDLTSRLIEGGFPDYQKIIPKITKTKTEVGIEDFILAVRKVSLFVAETNNNIKIAVTNDGKLAVSTDETQIGEGRAEINIKIEGENNKIALNAQYLLDVLNNIGGEAIFLGIEDKLAPVLIKPIDKKADYLHIIMPLKL